MLYVRSGTISFSPREPLYYIWCLQLCKLAACCLMNLFPQALQTAVPMSTALHVILHWNEFHVVQENFQRQTNEKRDISQWRGGSFCSQMLRFLAVESSWLFQFVSKRSFQNIVYQTITLCVHKYSLYRARGFHNMRKSTKCKVFQAACILCFSAIITCCLSHDWFALWLRWLYFIVL